MTHITQEQTDSIFTKVDDVDEESQPMSFRLHRFANAVIDHYIEQAVSELTGTPFKVTDKWESCRIADYNRGWNDALASMTVTASHMLNACDAHDFGVAIRKTLKEQP